MKPHPTDGVSLTFGLIFLGITLMWLFNEALDVVVPAPGWVAAGVLIILGGLGLYSAIRSERKKKDTTEETW